MKKQLNISWDSIQDATGYLFSFAKSLSCAVKNSPWPEYAEDIVATSGFAFRMWVNTDLCPSAKLAVNHLKGGEWCDNAKGLDAYPALIRIFEDNPGIAASWNAEYFLGTYGALKEYAYKYFEKAGKTELAEIYKAVFNAWMEAFKIKITYN
jgi:hypothetical protein